jgi:hypothetical protein
MLRTYIQISLPAERWIGEGGAGRELIEAADPFSTSTRRGSTLIG